MNEQEKIDTFNRDVDSLLKGEPAQQNLDPQRLDAARQLAAADFSAHSRARLTTRAHLLARAYRELPVQNKRKEMNTRFSNVFRTLAFGAFLLMIVFGLGWVLSNTTPQLGLGLETPGAEGTEIVPPVVPVGAGDVYLVLDGNNASNPGFVHLPADCFVENMACPTPETVAIVPQGSLNTSFEWSPDFSKVISIFTYFEPQVWIFDRNGETWAQMNTPLFSNPVWSPDGSWLVGMSSAKVNPTSNALLLARADGSEWQEILTDFQGVQTPVGWTDANHLLFVQSYQDTNSVVHHDLRQYEIGTGTVLTIRELALVNVLTRENSRLSGIDLSPDKSQIVYTFVSIGDEPKETEIATLNLVTGEQSTVTVDDTWTNITWSPDGTNFAVTTGMNPSTTCQVQIGDIGSRYIFTGSWAGNCDATWSPDGQYVVIPTPAQENKTLLFLFDVSDNATRQIEIPGVGIQDVLPYVSWLPELGVQTQEEPGINFPRQPADWGSMAALMNGRLVLVDGCLRIEDPLTNTNSLLIWPHDYDWQITEGIVEVLDRTGQVVVRVGEEISIGGGEADSLAGLGGGDSMQAQIPASCPGPYWLVSYGDIQLVEAETKVHDVIEGMGNTLQNVSLLSPTVAQDIQDNYAPYIAPDLLEKWVNDPSTAPGRRTSSPWPIGIEILIVTVYHSREYEVTGNIVEVTSEEVTNGGRANEIPVQITVTEIQGTWMITSFVQDMGLASSPTPLTLDSDSETIRQRMLQSTSLWQSLWADALVTTESKGEKHIEREQAWVNLPDQSRWLSGLEGTQPSLLQITSGSDLVLITAEGDRFESTTTRPQIADLETVIFPGDFARGAGTFEVMREEIVADRPALVVEWYTPEDRVEYRLWLDAETGIILRWQNLFPEPPDGSGKTEPSEIQIVKIAYNVEFSDEVFSVDQAIDLEFTEELMNIPSLLTLASTSEEIRQRILLSHTFWQTLWADAQITDYVSGTPAIQRVQVWVNQPAQARVLSGPVDGVPATLWISDGQMTRTGEDLSGYGLENFVPPMTESDTVYPHPMTGILPTPLSSLLFPSGLAQRGGTYRPIAIETLAGRETLVVEWNRPDGPLVDRFWVDTATGVILRQQNYGKGGDGALTLEYLISNIQYDLNFQPETFNRLAAFPPAFATGPEDIFTEVATPMPEGEPDMSLASGEIYMVLEKSYGTEPLGLWRFPANCLVSGNPCPPLESVPEAPQEFVIQHTWSPDGTQMIYKLIYPGGQNWRFDRLTQTWSLLDIPYLWGEIWSPDSQWLLGVPAGQPENYPLVLTRADGTEWQPLMDGTSEIKTPIAWLDDHRILMTTTLDNETSEESPTLAEDLQIYDLQSGEIQTLLQKIWNPDETNYGMFTLSPDRTRLSYSIADQATQTSEIRLLTLADNSEFSFTFPLPVGTTWSPTGEWLSLTAALGFSCEIHLVRPDGSDPHLVFTGDWGGSCQHVWSPDGQYILVSAFAQTPTIPRLYVINVATGESRLVELPDVGVEFEWPVVSWVP